MIKQDNKNIILGIDPGLASTGWGVIAVENNNEKMLDYGIVETSKDVGLSERLEAIHKDLKTIIDEFKPNAAAVEDIYFYKNVKTAIQVAQARGVVLMTAAEMDITLFEYTPLQIKQALVGYGRADKKQIQKMVMTVLNLDAIPSPDHSADALAIALCHAHSAKRRILLQKAGVSNLSIMSRGVRRRKRFYQ